MVLLLKLCCIFELLSVIVKVILTLYFPINSIQASYIFLAAIEGV